jgi:hypothetical protein
VRRYALDLETDPAIRGVIGSLGGSHDIAAIKDVVGRRVMQHLRPLDNRHRAEDQLATVGRQLWGNTCRFVAPGAPAAERRKRTAAVAHHAGDSLANVIPIHERVSIRSG